MLEKVLIFTRGGLILWTLGAAFKGSPIDALISSCLLEERSADAVFNYDVGGTLYTLKWAFNNDLGLVFVAVYHHISRRFIVDDLLAAICREFSDIYSDKQTSYPGFDETFSRLKTDAEARAEETKKSIQAAHRASCSTTKNGFLRSELQEKENQESRGNDYSYGDIEKGCSDGANGQLKGVEDSGGKPDVIVKDTTNPFDEARLKNLATKKRDTKKGRNRGSKTEPKKGQIIPPKDLKLDYTADDGNRDGYDKEEATAAATTNLGPSNMDMEDIIPSSEGEEEEEGENGKPGSKKNNWFSSVFQSIAGKAALENSNLEPALKVLKDRLMRKNVAEEIAEKLCESVASSLHGKKLGSFVRVSSTVKAAMEEALLRILTPKRSVDILREVHAAKEKGKPYVIVFIGVNGVGKSTNLAKVAYWLQQHDIIVMLAACDTFRSGAVEQLRTHACRLKIDIFEKGYERDPTVVAKEAIKKAGLINEETGLKNADVVLVDTAGRMQDNEPLMKALSKLINVNNPDLVLFVGEALVGNDAVDQLTKFNQKLIDLSETRSARSIDGILLTKFDTIDDKVGAALSMVYISGAPVMFVGCGQSYTDLKKLNIKAIVKTLLQ